MKQKIGFESHISTVYNYYNHITNKPSWYLFTIFFAGLFDGV